jgi:putative ABC transport system permease protein
MLKNYLKITFRNLLKNKLYSFINIFGLTMGTLCCLYIILYVTDQYSYDKQHIDAKDIYRVNNHMIIKSQGIEKDISTVVAPVTPLMKQDFAEVEQFTRVVPFLGVDNHLIRNNNKTFYETDAVYVDSTFFSVFKYHFVNGDASKTLADPYSVVLLKPTADKLFGKEYPIGKTITIENIYFKKDYTVKAVVDESLGKSHIRANIFLTMKSGFLGDYVLSTNSWIKNGYVASYVKLRSNTNVAELEKKLPAFVNKYAGEQLSSNGIEEQLYLQPITTIHTSTGLEGHQFTTPVSPSFLTLLLLIAIFIQLIACINFMNLSTARASKRAKEVGVRKILGAGRGDLIKQFLGESFLLSLLSVLIALPLLLISLPYLNQITQANIRFSFFSDYRLWLMLIGIIVITGLAAGSYPAFYLASSRAIKVIKGNFTRHVPAVSMRRSLVVFQFVLSIALITSIIIIYNQLNYIENKDLGFVKEQRLIFSFQTQDAVDMIPSFMDDLNGVSGIIEVTNSSTYLSSPSFYSNGFFLSGQKDADAKTANFIVTDEHFIKANGIKLLVGRDFRFTDSAKVLINETLANQLGLNLSSAVGAHIYDNQSRTEEIIGVMKDFNYSTLHTEVESFLIWKRKPSDRVWPIVIVNTNTNNFKELLTKIETIWHKDVVGSPFSYMFLDEEVQKQYKTEISLARIVNSFTLMAILISSLGLFGLSAFSAEQRTKEIGIRKVLGASIPTIVKLLSKELLVLVCIANIIAWPIAYYFMNKWLQDFAYRIELSWWIFLLSGCIALLIALITVSYQAIKAAVANPIESLRYE